MISSICIECEMWCTSKTSAPRLMNSNTIAPVTANRGKSLVRVPADTPTV